MNLTIERLNGDIYNLIDYNIECTKFEVSSPTPKHNFEENDDRDGAIDQGTTYGPRKIAASFEFVSEDFLDWNLLRNKIFKIFDSKESFYLVDPREPGKRWVVKTNEYTPQQTMVEIGRFDASFASPSTYAESIGTTLDDLTFDTELWQFGQGLEAEDIKYRHYTNSFSIFNAGDTKIDPREVPLKIVYKGQSSNLKITNNTTGESVEYTGTTGIEDTFTLDGVQILKNGISVFSNTNRKVLTLASGWNDFILSGTEGSFEITFDFRFYYL